MPFDPSAPIDAVLDAPPAQGASSQAQTAFDPSAPVEAEAPQFDPTASVDPEHPYVTKIRSDPTLSADEKQSRIDSYNEGLAKFDPDKPVSLVDRFTAHFGAAASDTLPALAGKTISAGLDAPFQAVPLPLRLAQAQVDALQREKDRRAGTLGDVLGDPTYAEYPDTTLNSELTKAQARVGKFMTPANVAAMTAEKTRLADIAAKQAGQSDAYANLPAATGIAQKSAAVAGEVAGGLTDPTNFIPLGEAPEGASLLKRALTTGKGVASQVATLEPVRQTLAVGANEPDQTGVGAATQHVASGFAGGMVLQAGSDALGQIVSKFKGVKEADVAGKTVDEAVPIIAAKTGQDPAAVAEQLKPEVPAKATVASGVERPATDTLSLNPEDKAQAFDPDAPVQAEGDAAPDQPKVSFADASGRVETSEDGPQPSAGSEATRIWESPQEGDKYQYTVQRPQPIPGGEGMAPGYTQVDVIRDGDSIQSSTPAQLRAQGHDVPDVPDHLPQGQYSREEVQHAIDNPPTTHPSESTGQEVTPPKQAPASQPVAEAPAPKGLIEGSPLKTWADQVVENYKKGTQASMTGGMDLFAARVVQGAAVLERGITDFAKWSKEMIDRFGEDLRPHLENIFRVAQELHGEGERAALASPEDVKDFVADYRNSDHEKITGDNDSETTPATRHGAMQSGILREDGNGIGPQLRQVASDVAPQTHKLSEDSGVALVRYAAAKETGPKMAAAEAGTVLGPHIHDEDFANKLGGVLVQDRLHGIKAGLLAQAGKAAAAGDRATYQEFMDHAANVTSLIGKPDSPFKTHADYMAALEDPEIKAAIERHKETVQPIAQKQHADLGGRIAQPGLDTGAFVNLDPLDKDGDPLTGPKGQGTRKGDLTAPRMKGSVHNQRAYGMADNYETDYNKIAHSMISGNFEETAKRQMYDQLTKDGLAVIMPPSPGTPPPDINGRVPRKIEIERRGLPSSNGARTLVRNLWVDPKIYPEVYKALNLDETFKSAGLVHAANVANWLQLKGPVNAIFHTANLLSSIAGQQGGKNVIADLIRKLPGVNIVDSLAKITNRARSIVADSAEVRRAVANLSAMGAGRAPFEGGGATSRFLQLVDHAARLVRNDLYDNMVKRGWAKDSEQARRDFVNQVGQYNPRLQGQITSKMKEWGVSPFVTAGISFNRQALRRVTGSPGVTPSSKLASVGMRAVELGGIVASLFAVPAAVNYALTGKPMGRPGVPLGAIDTGRSDAHGNAITIDPQQWTGMRRGLRLTGANAVATGVMKNQSSGEMIDNAGRDIVGGMIHPFAGPLVNTAVTATTGYNASFYKQSQKARPGESQLAQNAGAALKQLNPMVGNALQGSNAANKSAGVVDALKDGRFSDAAVGAAKGAAKPLLDAAGIKSAQVSTAEDQTKALAGRYTDALGISRDSGGQASVYGDLTKAVHQGDIESAQAELDKLIAAKAEAVPGNLTTATKTAIAKHEIAQYYDREQRATFTNSLKTERDFKGTLDGDQQATYQQAKADRREAAQIVRSLLYRQ